MPDRTDWVSDDPVMLDSDIKADTADGRDGMPGTGEPGVGEGWNEVVSEIVLFSGMTDSDGVDKLGM
jgi:hypothetical protein